MAELNNRRYVLCINIIYVDIEWIYALNLLQRKRWVRLSPEDQL